MSEALKAAVLEVLRGLRREFLDDRDRARAQGQEASCLASDAQAVAIAVAEDRVGSMPRPATVAGVRLVVIESPFRGGGRKAMRYLRAALADCIVRGEAPFASHGLYTQPGVLDDNDPSERETSIARGFAWRHVAAATVVYADLGISDGMRAGIQHAEEIGCPVELRTLPPEAYDVGAAANLAVHDATAAGMRGRLVAVPVCFLGSVEEEDYEG